MENNITEENPRNDTTMFVHKFVLFLKVHCKKANQNEAFLWNIAVLGMEKPLMVPEHFVPHPCWYFTFLKRLPAWRNVKYQHGQRTKCYGTNRGLFHSQNCNFPWDSLIIYIFGFFHTR
jgi:hypothetical protein